MTFKEAWTQSEQGGLCEIEESLAQYFWNASRIEALEEAAKLSEECIGPPLGEPLAGKIRALKEGK